MIRSLIIRDGLLQRWKFWLDRPNRDLSLWGYHSFYPVWMRMPRSKKSLKTKFSEKNVFHLWAAKNRSNKSSESCYFSSSQIICKFWNISRINIISSLTFFNCKWLIRFWKCLEIDFEIDFEIDEFFPVGFDISDSTFRVRQSGLVTSDKWPWVMTSLADS